MRRAFLPAALVAVLLGGGTAGPASAAPPAPPSGTLRLPPNWELRGGRTLTWTSPTRIPPGDAALGFYAGDRLLGRPKVLPDRRTFVLDLTEAADLDGLAVRASGRRLDVKETRRAPRTGGAAAAQLPANPVDPGVPGPYRTVTGDYSLADVALPGLSAKVEMKAVVVAPAGAPGKRPLALFLHGRHVTCFDGADRSKLTITWPCAAGLTSVPSYRGYLKTQQLLASQGYVTVSIAANGINGQDQNLTDNGAQARSSLVRLHLAQWAGWAADRSSAPAVVKQAPVADLSRVLLMGHSRGGEGVNRAATDSLTPPPRSADGYRGAVRWTIRGTVLVGPTASGQNPAPDVPSATILPGCDNDVFDLPGQMYADATRGVSRGLALHSSLFVVGANHNYFNTEWTPGLAAAPADDDFVADPENADPVCDPGAAARLTPAQQQTVGATYVATAARLFVAGDDAARPLLDGTGRRAPSADPARVYSQALGANRRPVIVPDPALRLTGATLCRQVDVTDPCLERDFSPHFATFDPIFPEPGRYAVDLRWSSAGTPATLRPPAPVTVAGDKALALRMFVPPGAPTARFGVTVTDTAGVRTTLGDVAVESLPATTLGTSYWGQETRVALPAGVSTVAALDLVPRTASGQAWLVDAWGWRPGTPAPNPAALPRVDVGTITEVEGDSGSRSYEVPVKVTGDGTGTLRLFSYDPDTGEVGVNEVAVTPRTSRVRVPVTVTADERYDADRQYLVAAKAVRGVVVGDHEGGVILTNDDPMPEFTVSPAEQTVTEGEGITYTVTLSEPAAVRIYAYLQPVAPAAGPELSTTDVDPEWFAAASGEEVLPERPMSQTGAFDYLVFGPGETTASVTVPTVDDGVAEPAEHLGFRLKVYLADLTTTVDGPSATATVVDR